MTSFIAVVEQMGGKSIRQLWQYSTCALLIAMTPCWKVENFFVSTLFLN